MCELFNEINAKAAARQEADRLAFEAQQEHCLAQTEARGRIHGRAKNAAFRRYTKLVALDGMCIGVILLSSLIIAMSFILRRG